MLDALFKPKTVAVVGASQKEFNMGNKIIMNLVEFGFKGHIYPINPNVDQVRGVKAHKSILDVPTDVDVVHLPIPAASVPQVIEECGQKNVKFVILNGGGFAEIGPAGKAIEDECLKKAKKYGIRLFGPNCQGIINTDPEVRAYCNFTFTRPEPGVVSIIALSGGVAELLHQTIYRMGVGTRMYASNGNARDVSIPEIIEYFGNDEGCHVIMLYIEGIRNPKKFLEVAQQVVKKKPIVVMQAGRSKAGAQAAATHTGALVRKDITSDLIFEKAGILTFPDEESLCQAASVFTSQPIPKGNRVGVITNAAGPMVIASDFLSNGGLLIPQLSKKSEAILRDALHKEVTVRNPIDVLATGTPEHFRTALDVLMEDDGIDSIFISLATPFFVDNVNVANRVAEANKKKTKPIVVALQTERTVFAEPVRILKEGGVSCFDFPSGAAKALITLTRYGEALNRKTGKVKRFSDVDRTKAEGIVKAAQSAGRKVLSARDAYAVLSAYGIPIVKWQIAFNADEAGKTAKKIGFPVTIKVDSEAAVHKSDMGGVALNLQDGKAVREAVKKMARTFKSEDLKFLVQKFLPGGKELMVGSVTEEVGKLVMCGMGGIFTEVLGDVAYRLTPLTDLEVTQMLSSLQAAPVLQGIRGEKGVDEKKLIEVIQRVSQLVNDIPAIQEMDLNPIIALRNRLFTVDVRICL
jgi:acyl-CoA synthetase (NDP forming)